MSEEPARTKLYKIFCVQTLPGQEIDIAARIANHLRDEDKRYSILKSLGAYDLLAIYEAESFRPIVSRAGPISGIVKGSLFYAYSRIGSGSPDLIDLIGRSAFTSLSFLKLHMGSTDAKPLRTGELFSSYPDRMVLLGSLGWHEVIAAVCGDSVGQIYERQLENQAGRLGGHCLGVAKSFSILGVNIYESAEAPGFSLEQVRKTLSSEQLSLDPETHQLSLFLAIACSPPSERRIIDHWFKKAVEMGVSIDILHLHGKYDIGIRFLTFPRWYEALFAIIRFRQEFADSLQGTSTSIGLLCVPDGRHSETSIP